MGSDKRHEETVSRWTQEYTMSLNDARMESENRDGRLTARKTFPEEKRIMDIVKAEALKKCQPDIAAFAECAKSNNIFVIFNCRGENRKMNDCVNQFSTEAHIDVVRQRRAAEQAAGVNVPTPIRK